MQRGKTKVSRLIYVNASINESFGRRKITPSNNAMKPVIAITATCIHVRKIGFGEFACFTQPSEYAFYLVVHSRTNFSLATSSMSNNLAQRSRGMTEYGIEARQARDGCGAEKGGSVLHPYKV